jgi:hypothetical protein
MFRRFPLGFVFDRRFAAVACFCGCFAAASAAPGSGSPQPAAATTPARSAPAGPIVRLDGSAPITRAGLAADALKGSPPGESSRPSAARIGGNGERSWTVPLNEPYGSPVFADLDGDGSMEVIVGDSQRLYVFDRSGALRPGWPQNSGEIDNSPAVGDLDGDGRPEIAVGTCAIPPRLKVYRSDGTLLPGFPVTPPWHNWLNTSSPVMVDLDEDGQLEVGIQAEDGVCFYEANGAVMSGWPYLWTTTQNLVWSAPAVGDIDHDGHLEVVVGNNCFYQESVHAIRADGTAMPGWPQVTGVIFSSVALGDLDHDGDLEIAVQEGDPGWYGNVMHVWHHDATYVQGWPREIAPQWESSRSNPAIVDVDGDGECEIVTATGDDMLHVFRANGSEYFGYPRAVPAVDPIASVEVVDVNGDGLEEFFLCYYQGGRQYVSGWTLSGLTLPGFPRQLIASTQLNAHGSAHLADIDGDGRYDLAACGVDFGAGSLNVFTVDQSQVNPARCDWPKIRRDLPNRGLYLPTDPSAVPPAVAASFWQVRPNPVGAGGVIEILGRPPIPGGAAGEANGAPLRLQILDVAGRAAGLSRPVDPRSTAYPVSSLFLEGKATPGVYFLRLLGPEGSATGSRRLVILK